MKTKITVLLLTIIIGLLISCNEKDDDLGVIKFTLIGQGNLYGDGQEKISKQNLTILDSNSWKELMIKMNTVNNVSDGFSEIDIDFANFIVIAVFDKVYGNGGHSIDITKITENENEVIVSIENILKGNITSVVTQPYHIVKIPKTNKLIFFE